MSVTTLKSLRYNIALWLLLLSSAATEAQDRAYARQQLDTLSSPAFFGRGYAHFGQQLAADYLLREFQRLGLQSLSDNYLQPFNLDVNCFDSVFLAINGKTLQPGVDYLVHPNSGQGEQKKLKAGKKISQFQYNEPPAAASNQWQLLLETGHPKLTWSVGNASWRFPYFMLRDEVTAEPIKEVSFAIRGGVRPQKVANVIGFLPGQLRRDSVIIICAHYDHLGMMGEQALFPGANDNASGTALLLDLARHYTQVGQQPAYSMLFIAFAAEEAGLLGSKYYVDQPLLALQRTSLVINLDLMAGGYDGMMMVNATDNPGAYRLMDSLNRSYRWLPALKARGNAANSDHYPFSQKGVPAIFLYTLGDVTAYHDTNDLAENLTLQHYEQVFQLLHTFIEHWPHRQQYEQR